MQAAALSSEMIGEPGERVVGMAQHIGAGAAPLLLAVDDGASRDRAQIGCGDARHRFAEHAARREEVVGDQRRRAQRLPFDVAVVDDLDRWMIGLDRLGDPFGGERRLAGREIARQPHRDLAFDADVDEIGRRQPHAAVMNALLEHAAATGMWDVEIFLHHRAGAADLVADETADLGLQQIVQRALHEIAFGLVARHDVFRKRLERRAAAARAGDRLCGREDPIHLRSLPDVRGAAMAPPSARGNSALTDASGKHEGCDTVRPSPGRA